MEEVTSLFVGVLCVMVAVRLHASRFISSTDGVTNRICTEFGQLAMCSTMYKYPSPVLRENAAWILVHPSIISCLKSWNDSVALWIGTQQRPRTFMFAFNSVGRSKASTVLRVATKEAHLIQYLSMKNSWILLIFYDWLLKIFVPGSSLGYAAWGHSEGKVLTLKC